MDETQTSRVSDAAAAATRKRRSSILKSQRPPRTPFSELEFNVATPTDTAKSRRVSFSRRTGVAEFATNEATTTWKNFYEEHNRSLESSGNECASKQIGHIGKRIFDQQFEVVEDDFGGIHDPGHMNRSLSLNTFNHQLLSLDRTEELKVSGNHSIMQLSTFTNTNLFGEPAMPRGEVTDLIDINFSNVKTTGNDDLDDIESDLKLNFRGPVNRQNMSEYIQVDLDTTQAALCNDDMSITDTVHSPEVHVPINVGNSDGNFKMRQSDDLDEMQRDLNKKYGLEMSMSQSINTLKGLDSKTKLIDGNCVVDKENIAVNPYAPLRETENFAVNEEEDKVLVFDGKRLTLQADKAQDEPLPPKPIENAQRKTIVLNFNDDLPNFVDVPSAHATGLIEVTQLKKNLVLEDMPIKEPVLDTNKRSFILDEDQGNITITQGVSTNIVYEDKRRTIHYDDSEGNISMTQALPTKIAEKRRTIVYDEEEGDMSITRAFPTNFLSTNVQNEKRNTIVFNDGNMSITQAIPSNIIAEKTIQRSTFVEDTQSISNLTSNEAQNQKTEGCKVFFEDDNCNFTVAQPIPSLPTKTAEIRRTIVYDDEEGDMSITRAFPTNFLSTNVQNEKRKTIVFNDGNMSITEAIPSNIIAEKTIQRSIFVEDTQANSNFTSNEAQNQKTDRCTVFYEDDNCNFTVAQAIPSINSIASKQSSDRRRTVVFEADTGNISVTQAVPSVIIHEKVKEAANIEVAENKIIESQSEKVKRRTIVYDDDTGDLSINQSVPNHILKTNLYQGFPPQKCLSTEDASKYVTNTANSDNNKRKTIVFDNDGADISLTQAVSVNQVLCAMRGENNDHTTKSEGGSKDVNNTAKSNTNKRKTIVFDDDDADISMTQAVSVNQLLCAIRDENKDQTTKTEGESKEVTNTANRNTNKRETIVFDNDDADISMTQTVSVNQVLCATRDENQDQTTKSKGASIEVTNKANSDTNKRKTIVFEDDNADISITQAVSVNQVLCAMRDENKGHTKESEEASNEVTNTANSDTQKRKTIVFDSDNADISMTQAVSVNQVLCAMRDENKGHTKKSEGAKYELTNTANNDTQKRQTIVFDNDNADISMTQAVSVNQVLCAMRDENKGHSKKSEDANNEVTNTANSDTQKRKTIVIDNDDADISMTQAVSVNQLLCAIRDENKDQTTNTQHVDNENYPEPAVTKSFVRGDAYADFSKTQAVPTNVIECFNFSIDDMTNKTTDSNNYDKRRTVVLGQDEGEISITRVINTETSMQKPNIRHEQDGQNVHEDFILEALHEVSHNKKSKGHRTIVYEKEHENLSVSINQLTGMEHAPSTSMTGIKLGQQNSVFGDVNSAADSLAEIMAKIRNNDENKQSNNQDTSEILNKSRMDTTNPENTDTEKRFDMSFRNEIKKVIRKALSPEVQSMSSSGINLQSLTKIQSDLEQSIRNEMTNVIRENYNDALVFQTALSLLTDKGDTKSANFEASFHKNLSSSKVDTDNELKQTEKISSETHSNEIKSLRSITNDNTSVSQDMDKTSARSKLFLNDLLDMSSSIDEIPQAGQPKGEDNKKVAENNSDDGVFVITHDQKESKSQTVTTDDSPQLIFQSPLQLEYKDKSNNESLALSQKIQNKLHNIKEVLVKSTNKTFDKLRPPILKGKNKEGKAKSGTVTISGPLALEDKSDVESEAKQSFVPKRQSIAISREDLINNLTMAGEDLKSQVYFDEDSQIETSPESENSPTNKVRISNEVVKTLQFDESSTEANLFQKLSSPLQKSAFGVKSYANDYKSSVIPKFTTVSDGIKELMDDLVKPNSDVLPFDCTLADKATNKVSTHSTEIQANLITSSQVDLMGYTSDSISNLNTENRTSSDDMINAAFKRAFRTPINSFTAGASRNSEMEGNKQHVRIASARGMAHTEPPPRVLVFDHFNPLNNILLSPNIIQEAHAYNPILSDDGTVSESNSSQRSLYDKIGESTNNVAMHYNISNVTHSMKQSGDSTFNRSKCLAPDLATGSFLSKLPSFDRSTEAVKEKDLKTAKVNTHIAMKGNLKLLEDHSSLTLVDDTLADSSEEAIPPGPASPMNVLYSSYTKDDMLRDLESELASDEITSKSKKRGRDKSKTTNRGLVNRPSIHEAEITPKPNKKIPKLSGSPYTMKAKQSKDRSEHVSVTSVKCNTIVDDVCLEKVASEYKVPIKSMSVQENVIEAIHASKSVISSLDASQTNSLSPSDMDADNSEMESSCTSSKNLRNDITPAESNSSKVSKMDLQPDVLGNELREDESGISVRARIEKLPYMGGECEWESRANDIWSFRLLHRRIRLMMRLQHRNDAQQQVSDDTAVQHVNVEVLPHESKNILAAVCVRFAADTMKWFVNRGCGTARQVPTLVRQCAAAARLAARWGCFMSEARHHLAYSLTPYGLVTLKVANIPLRCVWEVTLQLRLSEPQGSVAPWVEASDVTVRRVMSCAPVRSNDDPEPLLRDLPRDWSHAPRAIWKIFKYLKHMTRKEDDELFMA